MEIKIRYTFEHIHLLVCISIKHIHMYTYIYIYLSKLKSGERLTPPKANVCGERCARAVRACGARVRCARAVRACGARYMRAVTHAVRDTRAQ